MLKSPSFQQIIVCFEIIELLDLVGSIPYFLIIDVLTGICLDIMSKKCLYVFSLTSLQTLSCLYAFVVVPTFSAVIENRVFTFQDDSNLHFSRIEILSPVVGATLGQYSHLYAIFQAQNWSFSLIVRYLKL